jgi:glucose/arabinose dehydrogenase
VYSEEVPGARSMTLSPSGTLFVGTREQGRVYALPDRNGDGRPDEVVVIASGLTMPNGVAFRDGALYVAEISRILRYDGIERDLHHPPEPVVVFDKLPDNEWHGWKFIAFSPDGKLYVPIGAPCNICKPRPPYMTINRMDPDGTGWEVFARGVRNTVGFDWDPSTGDLWFTDNGRDDLANDLPPDELDHAPHIGLDFGFPYCYGDNVPDPAMAGEGSCEGDTPPALNLPAHVAPLGMRFYTGSMFPPEYRGQIFIAEHGSWDRTPPIGYEVILARVADGKAVGWEHFAYGWLQGRQAWGRPVDVQVMPDGALLVSDDRAGAIYRISYRKPGKG